MDTFSLRQRVEDSHLHRGCQRVRASGSGSPLGKEMPTSISEGKKQTGGKRESVSIFAKLQVLDYHSKLDATVTAKETMCMQKFALVLRCRGQLGRLVSPSTGHPRPTATFDMQISSREYIYIYILLRRSICLPHDHVKICAHASK